MHHLSRGHKVELHPAALLIGSSQHRNGSTQRRATGLLRSGSEPDDHVIVTGDTIRKQLVDEYLRLTRDG